MPVRKRPTRNNHLQEAMAFLIRNQAAFVEQIARNDQHRLELQVTSEERHFKMEERFLKIEERFLKIEERHLKFEERFRRIEEWQRKADERFDRIEAELRELPKRVVQTVLQQLPRIRKEIGFKTPGETALP